MKSKYMVDVDNLQKLGASDMRGRKSLVYFLYSHDWSEVLYVGQTRTGYTRIRKHLSKMRNDLFCNENVPDLFNWKAIEVEDGELDEVEMFYIKKLKPCKNKIGMPKDIVDAEKEVEKVMKLNIYNCSLVRDGELPLSFKEAYGRDCITDRLKIARFHRVRF